MSEQKITRVSRDNDTRETAMRPTSWKPASLIPETDGINRDHLGKKHRWIRKATYGVADPTNMSKRRREGWEPVKAEEYPELHDFIDREALASGLVEIGGLVLHAISEVTAKQMQAYYDKLNQQTLKSAEAMYQNQANAVEQMPIFKENKSQTKFGSNN